MEYELKRLEFLPEINQDDTVSPYLQETDLILVDAKRDAGYESSKVTVKKAFQTTNITLSKNSSLSFPLAERAVLGLDPDFDHSAFATQDQANQLFVDALVNLTDDISKKGSNILSDTKPEDTVPAGTVWYNTANLRGYILYKEVDDADGSELYSWVGITEALL